MRGGLADRSWFICAMNSVALAIQSQPARPDRVAVAGGNHDSGVVVSGLGDAIDDLEFSAGTGANHCADCYRERTDDFSAFEHHHLAVGNADQPLAGGPSRTRVLPR